MKKRGVYKKLLFSTVLIAVFFVAVYSLYNFLGFEYKRYVVSSNIKEEVSVVQESPKLDSLEYYKNYYSNEDIVGSLKIEGTNINTLIVKGTNNEYYLNHSLYREYSVIGSTFLDYRVDLNSKQINIYGHNSNVYDVIFKELESYLDSEYYKNHKYIELWDGSKTMKYEIFSVQVVTSDYEHMNVKPKDWQLHVSKLNHSIYSTGIRANSEDNILVIQTCLYNPVDSLLIINSRKV